MTMANRNIRRDYEVLSRFTTGKWAVQPETGQIYVPELRRMLKTSPDHDGYLCISAGFLGSNYPMARAVWIGSTLSVPEFDDLEVDHINGNRQDNRFANLRLLTHAGNTQKITPPLSPESAENIRREYTEEHTSYRRLAGKYRRNVSTIRRIVRSQHYSGRKGEISGDTAAGAPCPPKQRILSDACKTEIFRDFCVDGMKMDAVLRRYGIRRGELRAVVSEMSVKAGRGEIH